MRRMLSLILAVAMLGALALGAVSCNKSDPNKKTVMNIAMNPEVEFILDANDTVISVNALNEEGNLIICAETFIGKDAEEAARLFVSLSEDMGFLVAGESNIENNDIRISFSGDAEDAEQLYEDVSDEVNAYLAAAHIEAVVIQAAMITEAHLMLLAAECAPYIEQAKLEALAHMELVELIYESRKETADFYSQELKTAYYEAKAFAMERAELEILKSHVSGAAGLALELNYELYTTSVELLERTRYEHLVKEDCLYQRALANFRDAKVRYLTYKQEVAAREPSEVTEIMMETLTRYEEAVTRAEESLLSAGETAHNVLDGLKDTMKARHDMVASAISDAAVRADAHLEEISQKQIAAQTAFFNDFEESYASAITAAKTDWAEMKAELEADTAA